MPESGREKMLRVGPACVVLRDLPPGVLAADDPCRVIRQL